MVEGVVVLGNHVFLLGLGAVDVEDAALLQLKSCDQLVLTLLDHLVALVELGLSHCPLLYGGQKGLLGREHLEVLAEFLVGREEGVEVSADYDVIQRQLFFQSNERGL